MPSEYKRISQTYMERTTDEEILVDAGHAHRRVNERSHFHEELWVNSDWDTGHSKALQLLPGRSVDHPDPRQPLDGR